jgi:hypothetical protein
LTAQFGAVLQEYRFGIQARAGGYDGRDWFPASGITWGAYYQQTAHPYTVLLGNWSKEGATAAEKQKFSFTSSGDSDNPINYVISDQTGVFLDGGSLSSSAIWGGTVSFSIYINGYSSVQIYMTGDGKLQVSTSGSSYSYLDGPYTK